MRTLTWSDLRKIGRQDNAQRWYPNEEIAEYFARIRSPSRAWPYSYARAAQTRKFAAWLAAERPEIAKKLAL